MTKPTAIGVCGYIGITCSILLGLAAVWAYLNFHAALGTLAQSLRETTQSAAIVLDRIANTTKVRVDVADNTVEVLRSSRKVVQDVKAASEKQGAMLPQYAANAKDVASSAYEAAGSMRVVANSLSIQVPVRVEREGLIPVLVWGSPFDPITQALRLQAQRIASLGVSLDAMAGSLNGEARAFSASFVDNSNQSLRLIDSLEKLAVAARDEHMPQAITAMRRAKATLAEVGDQAKYVNRMGYALLTIGLLLAAVGGALSYATVSIATVLECARR